jgi:predicted RND superfamily exporter protein
VLVFADFKGFSEFGLIAGVGILLALVSMTVVLPAMLAVFERWGLVSFRAGETAAPPTRVSDAPVRAYRPKVVGSLMAVAAAVAFMGTLSFEYDFGSLEPTYAAYEARQQPVDDVDNSLATSRTQTDEPTRRNPAYILTDSQGETAAVVDALERVAETDTTSPTILDVESLQQRFPSDAAAQQDRLDRIAEIRELLDDPFLTAEPNADLDRLRLAAGTTEPVAIGDVPEALRAQYTTKSGEIGNFVVIYPSVGLSDGRNSIAFSDDVGRVTTAEGETFFAGSTSLVAADMLRLMMSEAPWMVLGTFAIVVLLMIVNFRSVRWAALAVVPLVVGILLMILGMEILGLKLNFYNLVVLPAILGIGNDAGVHIVHRYREEGPGSLRYILRSTGEHVFMSSLTTTIGFGGLLLSFHPGLRSIGQLAVLGIGTTVLAALVFLPALLQWIEVRTAARAEATPAA